MPTWLTDPPSSNGGRKGKPPIDAETVAPAGAPSWARARLPWLRQRCGPRRRRSRGQPREHRATGIDGSRRHCAASRVTGSGHSVRDCPTEQAGEIHMSRSIRSRWRFLAASSPSLAWLLPHAAATTVTRSADEGGGDKSDAKCIRIAFVGPKTGDAATSASTSSTAPARREAVQRRQRRHQDHAQRVRHAGRRPHRRRVSSRCTRTTPAILGLVGPAFSGETKAVFPTCRTPAS